MEIQALFWYWWILGAALLLFEIFAPGVFFIWMALAAGIMGLVAWAFPELAFSLQLLLFSLLTFLMVLAARYWFRAHPIQSDQPFLNQRLRAIVGQSFRLNAAIQDGVGKIQVEGTPWRVHGPDLPAGTKVRVVAVDGMRIEVEETP